MRSVVFRGLVGVAVLVALVVGTAVALSSVTAAQEDGSPETTILIDIQSGGDAQWTITMRFFLQTQNDSAAFDQLSEDYTQGRTDILDVGPFEEAAAHAERSTSRQMTVIAVRRSADRNGTVGWLELSFTWTNFARLSGDRMELGDVFHTDNGTWFPGLSENQELVIEFPREYAVRSSSRPLENGSYHVVGPATFTPGNPSAILERTGPGGTTTRPSTTPPPGGMEVTSLLGVGTVLVFLVVIGYLVVRRGRESPEVPPPVESAEGSSTDQEPTPSVGGGSTETLLSDEERVMRLLRENGGRMKQVDIVEETDWSNAKVSQLLSEMADQGAVDKLRIGRENLISLPGERPDELE